MTLCDQVRDDWLPELGLYIEDRQSLPAMVRPLDKSLTAAFEERKAIIATKSAEAQAARDAEESKKQLLAEKAKLSPFTMFRNAANSKWDERGVPIKNKDGKEVMKGQRKKLVKEWEKQEKLLERSSIVAIRLCEKTPLPWCGSFTARGQSQDTEVHDSIGTDQGLTD